MAEVHAEDIECVIEAEKGKGAVYIGNLAAAMNIDTLHKLNIKAVISMAKGGYLPHSQEELPNYLYIQAYDSKNYDLSPYFDRTYDFIDKNRKKTNILVHCMAGVSRSVTIVIAYLMRLTGKSMVDCYCMVKQKRQIVRQRHMQISPNEGFVTQLKKYEEKLKEETAKIVTITKEQSKLKQFFDRKVKKDTTSLDFRLNMSTDLGKKIEPINLQQKINTLRNKYMKNPQCPTLTSSISQQLTQCRIKTASLFGHGYKEVKTHRRTKSGFRQQTECKAQDAPQTFN